MGPERTTPHAALSWRDELAAVRVDGRRRKVMVLGALILISALAVFVIFNRNGVLNYLSLRRETRNLRREVDSLEAVRDSLAIEVERLRTDSAYIERMIREILGWGRPGEMIIRFQGLPPGRGSCH